MTDRLYYEDAYLTEFDAHVVEAEGDRVRLDRSAFYPTSGGQPFDTGTLNGLRVRDVYVDGALEVWHVVEGELAVGQAVHGVIDWPRRFDHMQQHAGEHMLASACYRLLGGMTIGLHLGHDASSIDVELPGGRTRLDAGEIAALEDDVNERIQRDVPIRCWFPAPEELAALPLRKPPTVKEHVRVVQIGEEEFVACGGTHPSSAGQIGLVKVIDARPSKGKVRLTFLCGRRAYEDYRKCFALSGAAAEALSTGRENLPEAVARLQEHLQETERALGRLRRETLIRDADGMLERAELLPDGTRLVCARVEADAVLLRELAAALTAHGGAVTLLRAPQKEGDGLAVFARAADVAIDMGRLMSGAAKRTGGKGGGKPDFAQGSLSEAGILAARDMILGGEIS